MPTPSWRPNAEVEIFVGTPPGGGQDRPARALMRVLESQGLVNGPMRLTNIPGKGGGNAWDALRHRAGDPHALSISSAPLLTNKLLGVTDYDHAALTPIAMLYTEYLAFVVRTESDVRSGNDFLARIKRDPAGLTMAIATAVGTTNHIALGPDCAARRERPQETQAPRLRVGPLCRQRCGGRARRRGRRFGGECGESDGIGQAQRIRGVRTEAVVGMLRRCADVDRAVGSVRAGAVARHDRCTGGRYAGGRILGKGARRGGAKTLHGPRSSSRITGPTHGRRARTRAFFSIPSACSWAGCCASWG